MALRLFLVGVVASLALDLPNNGPSPPRTRVRDARAWVETQIARIPEARRASLTPLEVKPTTATLAAVDVPPVDAAKPAMPADEIKPMTPVVTIRPTATIEATLPTAPAPEPVVVAEAPKADTPATEPAPIPTPMPAPEPSGEIVAIPSPVAEAAPAPIPSVAVTDPMAPPDSVIVAVPPVEVIAEAPKPADPDAAFRAIVATMAKQFAADVPAPAQDPKPLLAKADAPIPASPELAPPPPPAEEVADVADVALFPGFALALNRASEGLAPIPAEPAPIAVAAVPDTEPEPEPAPVTTEPQPDVSRAERLANAVKLTGQAVNAWAGLLSQRPTVSALQR